MTDSKSHARNVPWATRFARSRIWFPVLFVALGACSTMGGMRVEPIDKGNYRTYRAPLAKVLAASRTAMAGAGISVEEAQEIEPGVWMILGKKGMSTFSYGELIRVVVRKQDGGQVMVNVLSKRRGKLNVFAKGDYSQSIHDQIALQLKS
ncbi:MAG TPA: hypothetical protein VH763_05000 [Gemmatimonadales bacterium]|jgi:hypothetical protein